MQHWSLNSKLRYFSVVHGSTYRPHFHQTNVILNLPVQKMIVFGRTGQPICDSYVALDLSEKNNRTNRVVYLHPSILGTIQATTLGLENGVRNYSSSIVNCRHIYVYNSNNNNKSKFYHSIKHGLNFYVALPVLLYQGLKLCILKLKVTGGCPHRSLAACLSITHLPQLHSHSTSQF